MMKKITIAIILTISGIALAQTRYAFRVPTDRDRELAQLAGDWMFHDDWHASIPTNAYETRWKRRIPKMRASFRQRHATIPINVKSETNTYALLTYTIAERTLTERPSDPNPWPTPRMIVHEQTLRDGNKQFVIRWTGGLVYILGSQETTNGLVIISIDNMMHFD